MNTLFEKAYDIQEKPRQLLVEFAQLGYVTIKRREFELRVYDEMGGGKELSFHMIEPSKSYQVVFNAKTMDVMEWKWRKSRTDSIPKKITDEIKDYFHQSAEDYPSMTNWEYFIMTWNKHNRNNRYDMGFLPDWWSKNREKK